MMNFDKLEVLEVIRMGLCQKYIGAEFERKEIIDFEVELTEAEYRCYGGGGWHDSLVIYVILKTPKGRKSKKRMYL